MRWLLLYSIARARADLVFDPSVERVIVNVGSNTQPSLSHDPQTVAIAVEPMVGCRIREQRNLHVLHAAVAANNTLAFMQWYNKFGESSSLGTATEKAEQHARVHAVVQQVWGKFVARHGDRKSRTTRSRSCSGTTSLGKVRRSARRPKKPNNTLAFMQWYNKFGESSSLGTA